MSVINLQDSVKVNNSFEVKFGEKSWKLIFNDDYRKLVARIAAKIEKMMDTVNSDEWVDKLDNATSKQQEKMLNDAFDKMKTAIIDGLDQLLGEGAGEYLYEAYNHSTEKLSAIIQLLNENADEMSNIERNSEKAAQLKAYDKER
ncbi:MAG: hypothetical protein ACLUDD_04880 [Lactobacillus kalixensis]|uniref:hypothetical protein n=1 Tax=Lactobacillus kalixensis TaxID=227944 RepID=UPI0039941693